MIAPDGRPRIDRAALTAKSLELDATIQRLSAMRDGLRHAAVCSAPSYMECRRFRQLMQLAGAGRLGGRPGVPGAAGSAGVLGGPAPRARRLPRTRSPRRNRGVPG
jgi:MerR family redox-sensitive transcriptional activator SoxR